MRKEKNLKILPLILAAFVLTTFLSGCRINEQISSGTANSSASSKMAQSEQGVSSETAVSDVAASDVASSEIAKQENISSAASQNSSSKQNSLQSSSSSEASSQKPTSSQATSSKNNAPAHNHSFKTEKVDATCISAGYIKKTCSCGQSSTETIKALGHSFGEWKITVQPSTTSGGLKQRTCSRCGYSDVQQTDKLNLTDAQMQQEVFRLVNEERAKAGLPALTYNSAAQAAADKRAEEIKTTFSHTRPDGTSCFTVFDEYGISYRYAAENIAMGQTTPQQVMDGWMNSSGHRANILSKNATAITIGFNNNHWVQLFVG